jgi:polyisoprenoid-binding protein YceI
MSKSTWVLDPSHSVVEFTVKHMMIATVKGRFTTVEGTIEADPADLTTAQFTGQVPVATISTADAQRDAHLRSADFFDAENYPTLTFKSAKIERDGDGYKLVGDLTIRDVTKTVTWDLTYEGTGKDPWGGERIAFSAETKIDRREYGLKWNAALEAGGVLVGDQVKIAVYLEAVKKA